MNPPPDASGGANAEALRRPGLAEVAAAIARVAPIYLIMVALLGAMFYLNNNFAEPRTFLAAFLKPAVPLLFLAMGQVFVIIAGGFDLSVGALVTFNAVLAAHLIQGDPALTFPVIALLLMISAVVGLVNGTISTRLGVPSFITTLGMLLFLSGAALLISDGAPRGDLPENFRQFGRAGIDGVPLAGHLPYAVLVLIPCALFGGWLLHRTRFGSQILAVGGNSRAAGLGGVPVKRVRTLAFVISAMFAAVGGILLAGHTGISPDIGAGLEFQSIAAVVLGGAVLGGGRGSVPGALAGAVSLAALFTVLNLLGFAQPLRLSVQGLILIAAVSFTAFREGAEH